MDLNAILSGVEILRRAGSNPAVRGVEYDSRRVTEGSLFVAMHGGSTDGNRYIKQAVERGAVAVATDSAAAFARAAAEHPHIAVIQTPHGRRALAILAANFFGHPEERLNLTGITGTNGKTTTAFLLEAMLRHAGLTAVLAGTIEYHVAGRVMPAPHTTPESRDLQELFRQGVDAGASEGVMEVSSHALEQGRVFGLPFDVAVFTNLTRDHLDYHATMEAYFSAKARLFDGSQGQAPRAAILNGDDPRGEELKQVSHDAGTRVVFTYGLQRGDFHAEGLRMSASGMRFTLAAPDGEVPMETRLTGRVNVYNLLAASAAAAARGLTLEQIASGGASLPGVPGRFESIDCGQRFAVIVDYAHTDDALRNVLSAARDFVGRSGGRIITLFGCGGDRDRSKRPLMGQAAGVASDVVVLTSDNPRSEDPQAILDDVLPGLRGVRAVVLVEPDRKRAIRMAIGEARPGDLVLLAGKGHERTQILGDRVIPFDDAQVAREMLERMRKQ